MTPEAIRAAVEALERISKAQPDRLDHAVDVAIIERAASIASSALSLIRLPKHGCHCDIENTISGQPDDCVFDNGDVEDCIYATKLQREGQGKTDCRYWQPIKFAASPVAAQVDARRYRFLRDAAHHDTNGGLRCVGNCADGGPPLHITGRDLDRAVDAAASTSADNRVDPTACPNCVGMGCEACNGTGDASGVSPNPIQGEGEKTEQPNAYLADDCRTARNGSTQ